MPLEIEIQQNIGGQNPGAVTVKLSSSLDPAGAVELERRLSPVLAGSVKDLVFDLAQLEAISSTGVRVLLEASRRLKRSGGWFACVNPQSQIKEIFDSMHDLPPRPML